MKEKSIKDKVPCPCPSLAVPPTHKHFKAIPTCVNIFNWTFLEFP